MTKQVFEDIKVCDFSWVGAGPQPGRELAMHGATVVRVESHRRPDPLRLSPPFKDFEPGINRSAFGCVFNTQKLGMSLDYSTSRGQEVARRLIDWADVVMDSMTPGSLAQWGLDYESVVKFKPDVIYCSTCQMGHEGPYRSFGGYGVFGAAYAGFSHILGFPDRTPLTLYNNYSDFVAPWYQTTALIGALLHHRRTGRGMFIDQSQIEAGVTMLGPMMLDYAVNGRVAGRSGNEDPGLCPHSAYPGLGDDRWLVIAVRNEDDWRALCRVIGEPDWSRDPKFATLAARKENEAELDRLIGLWTVERTPEAATALLQSAGVPAAPMLTSGEGIINDPQATHREAFRWLEHSEVGPMLFTTPSYQLSATPAVVNRSAPCLGEDNEHIYKDILGYSDDEIAELMVEGVITTEADVPGAAD